MKWTERKTKYFYTNQILDDLDRYVVTESGHFVMADAKDRRKQYSVAEENIDKYRKNGYVFVLKKTRQAKPAASKV